MVPAPPVCSASGEPLVPVEWITVAPLIDRSPDVDNTLLERLASSAACTVTSPLPVVMARLTCTAPASATLTLAAYSVTLPLVVVSRPGVDRLPSSERKSMLPLVVAMSSGVSTSWVPATAVIDVVAASVPVSEFMLSVLASRTDTAAPVDVTVTWPVKSLSALSSVMLPAPP